MEIIEKKLNTSNPALVSQIFSRLVEAATSRKNGQQEFEFLKAKCLGSNVLLSDAARMAILKLVDEKILETDQVLMEFVTSISSASDVTSLTKMITDLMHLKFCSIQPNTTDFQSQAPGYKLMQHPVIKILQEEHQYDVQCCIYDAIQRSCSLELSQSLQVHKMYEPLYLYCLSSPSAKLELGHLRHKLWTFLLRFDQENGSNCIFKLCCWLQMQNKNAQLAAGLLNEILQSQLGGTQQLKHLDYLILEQILVIYNMVLYNVDSRLSVRILLQTLRQEDSAFCHHNTALFILAEALLVASPLCLQDLLQLCLYLASDNRCKPYSFLALKSAVLHWLASPSLLTEKALTTAYDILKLTAHVCRERPLILAKRLAIDKYHYLLFCNPELLLAGELGVRIDCTKEPDVPLMIKTLEDAPVHFLNHLFTYLCGLMLDSKLDNALKIRVLKLVVKCSDFNRNHLPALLSLLLHLLSITEDSNLHFDLLKALPVTAKVKENVPKVVATILVISKHSTVLNNMALRLMYDTWKIDNSCYPSLESLFTGLPTTSKEEVTEYSISRAYIFNKLAEERPELYGKDLVAHLSKILNECTTSDGAVAAALAINGIRHLCKAEIIDIVTTWSTLSPKFKTDKRAPVVTSLCKLIAEIPSLEYTESYDKLNDEVTQHLWSYVASSDSHEVTSAALDALSAFSLDWICMHFPEEFLEEGSSNPGENRVLPGKTWIRFLERYKFPEAACNFLTRLVSKEVDNYLKYVYQVKAQREPENYGALPTHSVVKALGEFLKRSFLKVNQWETPEKELLFRNCLRILSLRYSKPLPPLDWCFLQEVIHVPALKGYCLDLASHQAILSGSARRLVENYIVAVTDNPRVEDSSHVYRNLLFLANSIQPVVLKPFLENTLRVLLETVNDNNFEKSLHHLKAVLDEKDVQDVNKNVIEDVLNDLISTTSVDSQVFDLLLLCVPSFSLKAQEKVARFWSETVSEDEFVKITKIRCYLAKNTTSGSPLMWLHDVFSVVYKNDFPSHLYFEDFTSTLKIHQNHPESPHWLTELFGEIQLKVADRCDVKEIEHYCNMLSIAVVHFSGLCLILPKYGGEFNSKYIFTAALKYLLAQPMWNVGVVQILEWLHHMNSSESISDEYRHIYGWALCGLRHEDEFAKSSRWMRFLDSEIHDNKNVL